ncbi:MAG TPA: cytochrome c family protein [Burkholderiaceae bacterium]|jgi:cytochrome c|nr:cytochrome c family protein [Burkholderiaceae bacterium]
MRQSAHSREIFFVVISALSAAAHAAGDPARGADLFQQNCAACHSKEPGQHLVGPSLFSIVGRAAGSIAGFSYSAAMKRSGIVWTADRLMAYLKEPRRYLPGVKMMFPGLPDQRDREHVVAFLATLREDSPGSPNAADRRSP